MTTFLRAHSWLNWVDEDDDEDEVGLKDSVMVFNITYIFCGGVLIKLTYSVMEFDITYIFCDGV